MKKDIHPNYVTSEIKCACGNVIEVGSTVAAMKIDSCNKCHPFYTNKKQTVSSQGRAAKFMEKYKV